MCACMSMLIITQTVFLLPVMKIIMRHISVTISATLHMVTKPLLYRLAHRETDVVPEVNIEPEGVEA